jgi:hypothetical protein
LITVLLIVHGLLAVALIGAITHQAVSVLRPRPVRTGSFVDRYSAVNKQAFTIAVAALYAVTVVFGAIIYPSYRIDVRIPFEEMSMRWAVGLFELKEHFGGIGLFILPFYVYAWRNSAAETHGRDRVATTLTLTFIVWWDFLAGHIINNLRGLG